MTDRFRRPRSRLAEPSTAAEIVKGAVAGAAATWVMQLATTMMYERESDRAREMEDEARGGKTSHATAAERMAGVAGIELSERRAAQAGTAMHWATGMAAGAAYAVARRRWPSVARAGGLPFGAGFFLAVDEGMNTAFGFTPPPGAFPWQAHARGAAGHVIFGLVTHGLLAAMDRMYRPRRRVEVRLSTL